MPARRGAVITDTAVAMAAAVIVATSGRANSTAATKHPLGIVLDCSTQSGLGGAPGGTFRSADNLVVGPIAMRGAGFRPVYFPPDFGGQKFPVFMRAGHRVTVEVSRGTPRSTRLFYGQRRASRVVTFSSCRRDAFMRNPYSPHTACCFSFWSGGVRARSPQCVHLLLWVDDDPSPRRAVIHLGMRDCA